MAHAPYKSVHMHPIHTPLHARTYHSHTYIHVLRYPPYRSPEAALFTHYCILFVSQLCSAVHAHMFVIRVECMWPQFGGYVRIQRLPFVQSVAVVCTTPQTISKTSQTLRKYIHIPRHNTSLIRNNHQEWAGTKPRKNHKQGSGKAKYHRQTRRSSKT